ncbi:MAG TPA: Rpn family recombination-promoting nuclease/putative transposase [Spirochaetia bacterium]|nr:Rpn family recombination-promoting nuclease/putative transposase [Spirochaetia bacterium]
MDKSYILKEFTEIESDIVYRLQKKDRDIIFYVLLELQSTVDFSMPIRLFGYMVEIWRDVLNNTPPNVIKQIGFRLPVIIPAVLYNGEQRWTAARNFKEIQSGYQYFGDHVLDFRYILFDVNRYDDKDLSEAANVISSVFFLDKKINYDEILDRLREILKIFRKFDPDQLRLALQWAEHVFIPRLPESIKEEVGRVLREASLQEVENVVTNLGIALDEMKKDAKTEGVKEGEDKGKKATAKAALQEGSSVEFVVKITGLTRETVLRLKNEVEREAPVGQGLPS